MDFIQLLKSFGLDMSSVANALGIDMHTLNNMDHDVLLHLLTQQTNQITQQKRAKVKERRDIFCPTKTAAATPTPAPPPAMIYIYTYRPIQHEFFQFSLFARLQSSNKKMYKKRSLRDACSPLPEKPARRPYSSSPAMTLEYPYLIVKRRLHPATQTNAIPLQISGISTKQQVKMRKKRQVKEKKFYNQFSSQFSSL